MSVEDKSYKPVVARLLDAFPVAQILDAPCGNGWLAGALPKNTLLDGVDLFTQVPPGYREVWAHDLNDGLPAACADRAYDAVVSCEGIEHVSNPLLLMRQILASLRPGGLVILTTPNTWYPAARLQYLLRGFFPSFPNLAGKIRCGTHMHVMPWNFASLHLHLRLAGFESVRIHAVEEDRPRHAAEWLIGWPAWLYAKRKLQQARPGEELDFWREAGSRDSLFGRRLVVSALRPEVGP